MVNSDMLDKVKLFSNQQQQRPAGGSAVLKSHVPVI
jgi:hypothetical protein